MEMGEGEGESVSRWVMSRRLKLEVKYGVVTCNWDLKR